MSRARDLSRVPVDGGKIIPHDPVDVEDGTIGSAIANRGVAVEDYVTQANPANDAITAASRYSPVRFAKRTYTLPSAVGKGGVVLEGGGTTFSGPYTPAGLTDLSAIAKAGRWRSMLADDAGAGTVGSANEHVQHVGMVVPVTNSAAGYQKNASYVTVLSYDPSSYSFDGDANNAATPIVTRDVVGDDVQVQILPGNMRGRIFGRDTIVTYAAGGDGAGCGAEYKVVNNGSSQPWFGTATSKHGVNFFSAGLYDITSALYFDEAEAGTGSRWNRVMFVARKAVRTSLITMRENIAESSKLWFNISADGEVLAQSFDIAKLTAASVPNPPSGYERLFIDTANNRLRRKTSSGGYTIDAQIIPVDRFTSGSNFNCTASTTAVVVDRSTTGVAFIGLPSSPEAGRIITVKDGKGDAATNTITIVGTIDGATNYNITTNYGKVTLFYDGTKWLVIG